MKRNHLIIAVFFIPLLIHAQTQLLTLEEAILGSDGKLRTERLQNLQWIGDTHAFAYEDSVDGERCLVKGVPGSGERECLVSLDWLNETLAGYNTPPLKSFPALRWTGDRSFSFMAGTRLFTADLDEKKVLLKNTVDEPAQNVDVEPESFRIAYTRGNNLFIKLDPETEIQVTHDGNDGIVNGDPYVHRNEFGINDAIFWAPGGGDLAFYRKDETMVTEYPLVDLDSRPARLRYTRYPMAGMTSEEAQVRVYHVSTGSTTVLQTGEPKDHYLTSVAWTPDGRFILVGNLNRDQNALKMIVYDTDSGLPIRTLFEETNPVWVQPLSGPAFLGDGTDRFLWLSMQDGYNNLYLYDLNGRLLNQVTRLKQDVTGIVGFERRITEKGKMDSKASQSGRKGAGTEKPVETVFIETASPDGLERHGYSVNLKTARAAILTHGPGVHSIAPCADGTFFIDRYSSHSIPGITSVIDRNGRTMNTLLEAKNPLSAYALGELKLFSIPNSQGIPLNARMFLPAGFDPGKKYPVIIYVYGGPGGQMITDRWISGWSLWFHYLAQRGTIVFTLDNRGTGNRGWEFDRAVFRRLGTVEVEDQKAGVEYLKSLPYVDASRIGVHGWSYGGFMTISMMTRMPGVFKAGVAGGPVVDWHYYEVMYGERYMDTPMANPEGYEEASLFNYVQNLTGKLLIIHGTVDPVVVWQNSLLYLRKAIDAGKQVDYFVYPGDEHNMRGRDRLHLYQKITEYFEENL